MTQNGFEYDFVISYAGEDQETAEALNKVLTEGGAKVFYAPQFKPELWGENLYEYLAEIYSKKGIFCILVVSKSYVQKQWTRHEWRNAQERALKEISKAYILPVRVDDTTLPGLPETTMYLDIREQSATEIAQIGLNKLAIYKSKNEIGLDKNAASEAEPWEYNRLPSQRSSFLIKNNFLEPENETFAKNDFSKLLVGRSDETADKFFSLVAVTTPEAIDVDLDGLQQKIFINGQQNQIGRQDEQRHWLRFGLGYMVEKRATRRDQIWFRSPRQRNPEKTFQASQYLRFSEDGGIEFADGYMANYPSKTRDVFNFVYILGRLIMFINLATYTYTAIGYKTEFQLLINLIGTKNTILASFADDDRGTTRWRSPISDPIDEAIFSESQQGEAIEPNLQFAYDINAQALFDDPDLSFDIMVDLSRKLQRSYNYSYEPRHYIPDSDEFPWRQYYRFGQY